MFDAWQEIATTMRQNKLRTLLTAAGVFWGMFMILLMLGFGDGLEGAVTRNMGGFATNAVYIWGQRTTMPFRGNRPGRWVGYDNTDAAAIGALPGIEHLAPRNQLGGYRDGANVVRGGKTGNFQVMGDVPAIRHILTYAWDEGRFLDELDLAERRKVVVIGRQVVDSLFARGEDPIGQWIAVRGVYFQVVGVFHSVRGDDQADRDESTLHVPFTTFQQVFNYGDRVGWFALTGKPDVAASALEADVRAVLADRHDIHPDDEPAIGSFNAEEEFGKVRALFTGIRGFVWIVGVLTLLSGVVGVSNILLVVVRERTAEIGIRRALGATPGSIMRLIVTEALVLTSLAGYVGLVAGVAVLELVALVVGEGNEVLSAPQVDLSVALSTVVVLTVAGALAGVIPAQRAAAIHPVEALRS